VARCACEACVWRTHVRADEFRDRVALVAAMLIVPAVFAFEWFLVTPFNTDELPIGHLIAIVFIGTNFYGNLWKLMRTSPSADQSLLPKVCVCARRAHRSSGTGANLRLSLLPHVQVQLSTSRLSLSCVQYLRVETRSPLFICRRVRGLFQSSILSNDGYLRFRRVLVC
jgi:hypothetical protein